MKKRSLFAVLLPEWRVGSFLQDQIDVIRYRLERVFRTSKLADRHYFSDEELWAALRHSTDPLKANTIVHLHQFALTEWMPRTPGLFHHPNSYCKRALADKHRYASKDFIERAARAGLIYHTGADRLSDDESVIYDPKGKSHMIDGGIGCIRLKDTRIADRRVWLMGATSSDAVHEGVPVALNSDLYRKHIDRIARGEMLCDITAIARFVPTEFEAMYRMTQHLPQIYLEVEDIKPSKARDENDHVKGKLVTAAIGFRGRYRDKMGLYTSYTSFENGDDASLKESVEWLEELYVKKVHDGEVVTDFDQQSRRFAGAVFNLDDLLHNKVSLKEARSIVISVADKAAAATIMKSLENSVSQVKMTMTKKIQFGDHAVVHGDVQLGETIKTTKFITMNSETERLAARLDDAIKRPMPKVPEEHRKKLARDGAALKKKLASKRPTKDGVTKVLSSIERTANIVGSAAKPIAGLAATLAKTFAG